MTAEHDDELFHLDEDGPPPPARRSGRWVLAGLGAVLVAVVVGLASSLAGGTAGTPAAAAAPATTAGADRAAAGTTAAAAAPAPVPTTGPVAAPSSAAAAPSTGALGTLVPTPAPDGVKETGVAMTAPERVAAEAELRAFAAAHLQSPVALTGPAGWAGQDPGQAQPDGIATCPHLADRLEAELGGRWTYTWGGLPGQGGCTWTPVPWVPEADPTLRFFETVAFLPGADVRSANVHTMYQAAGTQCPQVDTPAVGDGAFAARCQDPDDLTYVLVVPDAGGRGVWELSTYAGHAQRGHTAPDGLLALVRAVQAVY